MGVFCIKVCSACKTTDEEGCAIKQDKIKQYQMEAAQKQFEWFSCSTPSTANKDGEENDSIARGIALSPYERGCGQSYPMRGTNSDDLTEWCIKHET